MFLFPKTPDDVVEKYKMLYNSGIIDWHEKGRHGVIRNIKPEHMGEIYAMLVFYLGEKCGWRQKNADRTYSLEFVYQGNDKVTRPWYYCDKTILFADWKERDEEHMDLMDTFHLGDKVRFVYRNVRYEGIVAGKRKRLTIIASGRKFYIPGSQAEKVE